MAAASTTGAESAVVRELRDDAVARRREARRHDAELDDIAGHLNALHGRLIDEAAWLLDHPEDWSGPGVWKPEQFLAWRCGVSHATARKIVDIARRVDELPETVAAVRAGELSLDQAAAVAKRVPSWAEADVARLARKLTVHQIQRTVAAYPFGDELAVGGEPAAGGEVVGGDDVPVGEAASTDGVSESDDQRGADEREAPPGEREAPPGDGASVPEDRCWYGAGDDGRWRLVVETTRDVGAVVEAALDEARDARFRRDGGDVSSIDALLEVSQRSLGATESPARRERFRVNVHLRTDGTAVDANGARLPDAIRRHLSCDGLVTPIFLDGAMPVSVGRSERIVPERTRRMVLVRDGGCRVPGCGAQHHLEVHHIVHWSDGGPTDTWNLIALCPRHHRLHHQGRLGLTGDADQPGGVTFTRAGGRVITASGASPNPPTGPPPPISGNYRHPLGERLDAKYVEFHPPGVRCGQRAG